MIYSNKKTKIINFSKYLEDKKSKEKKESEYKIVKHILENAKRF